ncbi:MAG: hypothetical protein ACPGYV_02815 [Phycisphaeraceae bacterium]
MPDDAISNSAVIDAVRLQPDAAGHDNGYGRARLRLGISGVGLWVVVSVAGLASGVVESIGQRLPEGIAGDAAIVALLLVGYVVVQLPFDWLGGYRVPKRFGRAAPNPAAYAKGLARGVVVHTAILLCSAAILYLGGRFGGIAGAFVAGLCWLLVLASGRGVTAHLLAKLRPATTIRDTTDLELLESGDEGFTGGITGLIKPKTNVLPAAWRSTLTDEQFQLAIRRRRWIIASGAWRAGRIGAFVFSAVGLLLSLLLAGADAAGTGAGVVETMLWFTLWSFAGLLLLPTLSRRAVVQVDRAMVAEGTESSRLNEVAEALDRLQDAEPRRPGWVESIFHPVPSVSNRWDPEGESRIAYWDIARTAVYLGLGGGSLLTRSVHCNVGRPSLWAWLPT